MTRRAAVWFVLMAMISACRERPQQRQEIARVNDESLTLGMIKENVDSSHMLTELEVRSFANRWVISSLLFEEAKRQGLDNSESVQKNLSEAKRQLVINALLEKEVFTDSPASLSRDQVQRYYNEHRNEFVLPEDVVYLSHAVFSHREPANAFRVAVLRGKDWGAAVAGYGSSLDSTMIVHADSAFYTEGTLYPPQLWKVAATMGKNEVSFAVQTSAGYFVLKLLGKYRKGSVAPLEYVDQNIRGRLVMEKRQQRYSEFLDELRQHHAVRIFLSDVSSDSLLKSSE